MDYYGPPPGEKPARAMDLKAWVMMGGMALVAFLYMSFIYIPKQQEWQEKQREREQAEASATPGTSPVDSGTSAVGSGGLATGSSPAATGSSPSAVDSGTTAAQTSAAAPVPAGPLAPAKTVAFETPSHTMKLSTRGASLEDLTFKAIHESTFASVQTAEADKRPAELFHLIKPFLAPEDGVFGLAVEPEDKAYRDARSRVWKHTPLAGGGHRFSLVLADQWALEKDYLPPNPDQEGAAENPFHFRLVVRVINKAEVPRDFSYWLHGTAGIVNQDMGRGSYGVEAVVAGRDADGSVDTDMESATGFDVEDYGTAEVTIAASAKDKISVAYHGLVTKYFTSMVVPLKETRFEAAEGWALLGPTGRTPTLAEEQEPNGAKLQAITRGQVRISLPASQQLEQEFLIYIGPRQESDVFKQEAYAPHGLDELVYYGWALFAPIGRVLHKILEVFSSVLGNWGLAILCLTVLVRLLILPLSLMQQKSAIGMQKLTPELNALREKLGGKDGQMTREQQMEFSQAQMALFKKHGVNPIGCLGPLFLQMPIFIALYQVCFQASDLRGAPFFLWIKDLSSPDVLFRMPFTIPFLDTNAFSLLPLILVCLYVLQQKIQPPPADAKAAEQQRIMKFIFPVFGLLFYTMPSGLLVYWVASTLWGICEQKFVKNKLFPPEPKADPKATPATAMPGLAAVGETLQPATAGATEGGDAPATGADGGGKSKKNKRKGKKKRR